MQHLDDETLLAGLEGQWQGEDAAAHRAHLAECESCRRQFAELGVVLDSLTAPVLRDAPPSAVARANAIFSGSEKRSRSWREVVATLVFDSWATPEISGLRGSTEMRQLALESEHFDLHIGVDYDDQSMSIRGQILSRDNSEFAGAVNVRLLDDNRVELDSTYANRFGEFAIERASLGGAIMAIRIEDEGLSIRCPLPEDTKK